jgi:hypothetical protein
MITRNHLSTERGQLPRPSRSTLSRPFGATIETLLRPAIARSSAALSATLTAFAASRSLDDGQLRSLQLDILLYLQRLGDTTES